MAKPTILPEWASNGTTAEIGTGPSGPKRAIGYVANEQPSALVDNWLLYHNYKWAEYLDGFEGEPHTWTVDNTFTGIATFSGVTTLPGDFDLRYGQRIINHQGRVAFSTGTAYGSYAATTDGSHSIDDGGGTDDVWFDIGMPPNGARSQFITWRWKSGTGSVNATVRLTKQTDAGEVVVNTLSVTGLSGSFVTATLTTAGEVVASNTTYLLKVSVTNAGTTLNIGRFSWAFDKVA